MLASFEDMVYDNDASIFVLVTLLKYVAPRQAINKWSGS